jgi:hypothetical protein
MIHFRTKFKTKVGINQERHLQRNDLKNSMSHASYMAPNSFGTNRVIAGTYVTSSNVTIKPAMKINNGFVTASMLTPPTLHPTNKLLPDGGLTIPMQRLKTKIIPKCTGSIPM